MGRRRVVVGSTAGSDPDDVLVRASRRRREAGQEVVHLGPGPSAVAIARVVVAEDATEVLVPAGDVDDVRRALADVGAGDVEVTAC